MQTVGLTCICLAWGPATDLRRVFRCLMAAREMPWHAWFHPYRSGGSNIERIVEDANQRVDLISRYNLTYPAGTYVDLLWRYNSVATRSRDKWFGWRKPNSVYRDARSFTRFVIASRRYVSWIYLDISAWACLASGYFDLTKLDTITRRRADEARRRLSLRGNDLSNDSNRPTLITIQLCRSTTFRCDVINLLSRRIRFNDLYVYAYSIFTLPQLFDFFFNFMQNLIKIMYKRVINIISIRVFIKVLNEGGNNIVEKN